MSISRELFVAVKCSPIPIYKLAQVGGWRRPEQLSRILHGARAVGQHDLPRLKKIAAELGVRGPVVKDIAARGGRRAKAGDGRAEVARPTI